MVSHTLNHVLLAQSFPELLLHQGEPKQDLPVIVAFYTNNFFAKLLFLRCNYIANKLSLLTKTHIHVKMRFILILEEIMRNAHPKTNILTFISVFLVLIILLMFLPESMSARELIIVIAVTFVAIISSFIGDQLFGKKKTS